MTGLSSDLVITGGTIITVSETNHIVEAVAVLGDRIIAVGTADEIAPYIGDDTTVIELNGRTMLPGFNDSHTHFMNYAIRNSYVNCRTPPNKTIADIQERISQRAAETPKGEWILCQGMDEQNLAEKRFATRDELDEAAPDHPVYVTARVKHAIIVNSKALEKVGYSENSPQPAGGHFDKDPSTGRLTGVLREKAAFKPVDAIIPRPTKDQMKNALGVLDKIYASAGLTSTGDAGAPARPETYQAFQEAIDSGLVKTRVNLMIHDRPYADFYLKSDLGFRSGFGNDRLRMGPVKTCTDGSFYVRTCAFYEPYKTLTSDTQQAHPKGVLQFPPAEISELVAEAHKKGYQIAIHAQGDYGIDVAIDALQYALWKYPRENCRHRIEHTQCVTPEGLKRMKHLGIIANFMPGIIWYWGDWYVSELLGKERSYRLSPMRSAIDEGLVTMLHADMPVFQIGDPIAAGDPLFTMWCAVNRSSINGEILGPDERITPMEAIRAFTINSAYASFEEKIKGSIEPGKLADFVILSQNPLECDPMDIRHIQVEQTIIGGETVFKAT